jgi:hypothetical protein
MQSVVELTVIAVVIMEITVFRDATPCSLVELVHILEKLATPMNFTVSPCISIHYV